MNFDMTGPCEHCPFRTDCRKGWLGGRRAEEIIDGVLGRDGTFACHRTTEFDDEGEHVRRYAEQHCAGALILLEKLERPNQMMRIAERLGLYDRAKLNMASPVFNDECEFIEHHTEG